MNAAKDWQRVVTFLQRVKFWQRVAAIRYGPCDLRPLMWACVIRDTVIWLYFLWYWIYFPIWFVDSKKMFNINLYQIQIQINKPTVEQSNFWLKIVSIWRSHIGTFRVRMTSSLYLNSVQCCSFCLSDFQHKDKHTKWALCYSNLYLMCRINKEGRTSSVPNKPSVFKNGSFHG